MRKHIVFYGDVQGVGFRYRAYHAANSLGVTGWVRNNYDGTVEAEFQGREEDIDRVLIAIDGGTFIRITEMDVKRIPEEQESSFRVR